ncbi:proliferating cell nuclear antigen (pcna) [Candidatus Micrarchaeota archaeon]|nr:proliferating cell nuclear antigen (pcna) [Candidatus Micrarchaeota archaeon]
MRFSVKDAKFFKSCVDAIVSLVDEGSFVATKEGLHLRTMDPSQIAMVDFRLPATALDKLDVDEKSSATLNLVDFSKILSRSRAGESLEIVLDEKDAKLQLTFTGSSKRVFKMPLLDSSTAMPKEPNVPFDAQVKIQGGALKSMLQDAGLLSSHVIFDVSEHQFNLEAKGDAGDVKTETMKDSDSLAALDVKKPSRSMYPFDYLNNITKGCPDDAAVNVHLKSDAPIKITYPIGDAQLTYYLAPRVENE